MPATSTAAPPQNTPERCSNCKAKLPDTPVSLCPYCAMPILEGQVGEGVESKNTARLQKVRASEHFDEAMAFVPPEGPEYQQAGQQVFQGKAALALAAVFSALALSGQGVLWWILAGVNIVLAHVYWPRGARTRSKVTSAQLLKRPAVILSRRSDVELKGWVGETTYFFELEFEDGAIAEFRYPGRGSSHEPYTNNMAGVAYTRGDTLLFFRLIRT